MKDEKNSSNIIIYPKKTLVEVILNHKHDDIVCTKKLPESIDCIMNLYNFPRKLIVPKNETENLNEIITMRHFPTCENYKGLTGDVRGETLYFDKNSNELYLIRGCLRLFTTKFTDFDENCKNDLKELEKYSNFILTPKFDGSLMNIVFIPKSPLYEKLNSLMYFKDEQKKDFIHYTLKGMFIIGSMSKLVNTHELNYIFLNAIKGQYNTVSNLISKLDEFVSNERITFHFEAIDTSYSFGYVEKYPKSFVILFRYTIFDEKIKKSYPPSKLNDKENKIYKVKEYEFSSLDSIVEFLINYYKKLVIENDFENPVEGYVCEFGDDNLVKIKSNVYRKLHKPNKIKIKEFTTMFESFSDNFKNRLHLSKLYSERDKVTKVLNKKIDIIINENFSDNKKIFVKNLSSLNLDSLDVLFNEYIEKYLFLKLKKEKISKILLKLYPFKYKNYLESAIEFLDKSN